MGVLLNSIKPCFNWKASLHFPIIWSKLKADAHSLIRSLISVPGNQNSLSLLCRDSFANCTQFQRFSKENLSMQSVNCHSVNNCLNIQTTQQLPIKKIKLSGLRKQTDTVCHGWARPGWTSQTCLFSLKQWRLGETYPRSGSAYRGGQRTAVFDFWEDQRLQGDQTALGGKGQKPCYKLCFQRTALLSKNLASKVLIGPLKINPFNERINRFRTQTGGKEKIKESKCCEQFVFKKLTPEGPSLYWFMTWE